MARVLLEIVLPFLAPFLVFVLYTLLVTRGRRYLERTPWFFLIACGLVLACLSLASLAFLGGHPPGGEYVPPHVEGGRIVPAETRRPDRSR